VLLGTRIFTIPSQQQGLRHEDYAVSDAVPQLRTRGPNLCWRNVIASVAPLPARCVGFARHGVWPFEKVSPSPVRPPGRRHEPPPFLSSRQYAFLAAASSCLAAAYNHSRMIAERRGTSGARSRLALSTNASNSRGIRTGIVASMSVGPTLGRPIFLFDLVFMISV